MVANNIRATLLQNDALARRRRIRAAGPHGVGAKASAPQGRLNPGAVGSLSARSCRRHAAFLFRFHYRRHKGPPDDVVGNVMTVIGDIPGTGNRRSGNVFAPPPGFCWRLIPEGAAGRSSAFDSPHDARAVVVWVGAGDTIERGEKLIGRLLRALGCRSSLRLLKCTTHMQIGLRRGGALSVPMRHRSG